MATSKKFSELPAASSVGNGDLFAIAHEDAQAETGYASQKATASQIGQKVNGDTEYPTSLPSFPENGQNPFAALEKLNSDIIGLYPVNTASGSIASFDTSLALPLVECKAQIVAQQAGTGTPSPQNVRSISGFESVKLTRCGKNLFKNSLESQTYNGVIYTVNSDGSITLSGQATSEAVRTFHFYLPAGTYIYTSDIMEDYATYDTYITSGGSTIARGREGYNVFTLTEYSDLVYGLRVRNGVSPNITIKPMVRVSTDTDNTFEPYNAETKTIALGQTVYGGSVDAKSGTATITYGFADLSTLNWTYSTNQNGWYTDDIKNNGFFQYNNVTWMSDIWNPHVWTGRAEGDMVCNSSKTLFCLTSDTVNTPTGIIVYELATPITLSGLTPDNFTTFAGENNIFADCGDVEVSFKQGIQEYIDAKIAETQALIL